jgi:hypothetical protein
VHAVFRVFRKVADGQAHVQPLRFAPRARPETKAQRAGRTSRARRVGGRFQALPMAGAARGRHELNDQLPVGNFLKKPKNRPRA